MLEIKLLPIKVEAIEFAGPNVTARFSVIVEGTERGSSGREVLIKTVATLLGINPRPYLSASGGFSSNSAVLEAMFLEKVPEEVSLAAK